MSDPHQQDTDKAHQSRCTSSAFLLLGSQLKKLFQIVLLGDADEIVQYLCEQLEWDLPSPPNAKGGLKVSKSQMNGKRTSSEMIGQEPTRVPGR